MKRSSKPNEQNMKAGDIVKFKKVVDKGDETVRMQVNWVDGGRVHVTALMGMELNPTYIYPETDLVAVEDSAA